MNVQFDQAGVRFAWDARKALRNLAKHGVSFPRATQAFFDPFLKVIDVSEVEAQRNAVLGMDESWNILFVVHLVERDETIRIISARRVTALERNLYEQ